MSNSMVGQLNKALLDFEAWYVQRHGYLACLVCSFGIVANALNIVVLTRKSMKSSTNCILTGLAVSDGLTMLAYLPFALHFYVLHEPRPSPSRDSYVAVRGMQFYACFSVVVHSVSIWLTVVLAIFRYVIVKFPVHGGVWCCLQRAKMSVAIVYVVTTIVCVPNTITVTIKEIPYEDGDDNLSFPDQNDSTDAIQSKANATFWAVDFNRSDVMTTALNFWIQALLVKLLPCCGLTVLSILLIKTMKKANEKRNELIEKNHRRAHSIDDRKNHDENKTPQPVSIVLLNTSTKIPVAPAIQGSEIETLEFAERKRNHSTEVSKEVNDIAFKERSLSQPKSFFDPSRTTKNKNKNFPIKKSWPGPLRQDEASLHRLRTGNRNTNRTTRMLVSIVVLFLITEFSQGILNLISGFSQTFVNDVYIPLGDFLDILTLINSAINFILYCSMSKQYRDTFLQTFCNFTFSTRRLRPDRLRRFEIKI